MNEGPARLTTKQMENLLHDIHHISPDRLVAYVSQFVGQEALDTEEAEAIEAHLFLCDTCRSEMDRLSEERAPWRDEPGAAEQLADISIARATGASVLARLLEDASRPVWVREKLIDILLEFRDFTSLTALVRVAVKDRDESVQQKATTAARAHFASHLASVLNNLEDMNTNLREYLSTWKDQLRRGNLSIDATLNTRVGKQGASRMEFLPLLSNPSLNLAYVDRGEKTSVPVTETAVLQQEDGYRMQVIGGDGKIFVHFREWKASLPPLVVLIPEDPSHTPLILDVTTAVGTGWQGIFENVQAGVYLLLLAPTGI